MTRILVIYAALSSPQHSDDPHFKWHPEVVRAIHDQVLAGSHPLGAGRYRDKQVFVADGRSGELRYTPPEPDEVPGLLGDATADMADAASGDGL